MVAFLYNFAIFPHISSVSTNDACVVIREVFYSGIYDEELKQFIYINYFLLKSRNYDFFFKKKKKESNKHTQTAQIQIFFSKFIEIN